MKQYIIHFQVETESYTDCDEIATFNDLKTAQKEFKKAVKNAPRYRQTSEEDFKGYLNESITLEVWIDNNFEDKLEQQIIYSEGIIDRMNYKGNYAMNYYSRATFNGKELMHEMYYDGKKEMWGNKRKVPNSQLDKWYYR